MQGLQFVKKGKREGARWRKQYRRFPAIYNKPPVKHINKGIHVY
jgi:hypothetical protein